MEAEAVWGDFSSLPFSLKMVLYPFNQLMSLIALHTLRYCYHYYYLLAYFRLSHEKVSSVKVGLV